MKFQAPTPIFRIFDESKAREFYIEFLEFNIDWEHRFSEGLPIYMQVTKGHCSIHLSGHHGDCAPGSSIRIPTEDIDEFQQKLISKQYTYSRPGIESKPWNSREMYIMDPFYNRLIFFENTD